MHAGNTNLIMEYDGTLRRFKRSDSNQDLYISVTPEGELKALVSCKIIITILQHAFHNYPSIYKHCSYNIP